MKPKSINANTNKTDSLSRKREESKLEGALEDTKQRHPKKDERDIKKELSGIRSEHLKEMRDMKTNFKNELALLRKRFDERLKNEKDSHKKTYEKQKLMLHKDQETMMKNQLREVVQNYSNLASNYQKELGKVRQVQQENDDVMRKKDSEIMQLKLELAKSASDLQARRLIIQLAERNALIERLQSRIEQQEALVSQSHGLEYEERLEELGGERVDANGEGFDDEKMLGIFEGAEKHQAEESMNEGRVAVGEDPMQEISYGRTRIHRPNGIIEDIDNGDRQEEEEDDDEQERESEIASYDIDRLLETRQESRPPRLKNFRSHSI